MVMWTNTHCLNIFSCNLIYGQEQACHGGTFDYFC